MWRSQHNVCEHSVPRGAERSKLTALCWQVLDESAEVPTFCLQLSRLCRLARNTRNLIRCIPVCIIICECSMKPILDELWKAADWILSDQAKAELSFLKPTAYHVSWECASRVKSVSKKPFQSLWRLYCVAKAQRAIRFKRFLTAASSACTPPCITLKWNLLLLLTATATVKASWVQNGAASRQIINSLARPCCVYPKAQLMKLKRWAHYVH